jgi:glycogen phosphorylase
MPGSLYQLEVSPILPPRIARLEEVAMDLWYSWSQPIRNLLGRIDRQTWVACGRSPRAFLKRVDQRLLDAAAADPVFLGEYNWIVAEYDAYKAHTLRTNGAEQLGSSDLIAYFCAEYGLHDSLPIYSGGLGILAGDHCKAASDMRLPLVGIGLMYRQGYFRQTLDLDGRQQATYLSTAFEDLPIYEAVDANGVPLRVVIELGERPIHARIWRARAGHVSLALLDTDVDENNERDRGITHRLYGGDRTTRIEQEIVLGIGGVRAIEALGLAPTVWHINEGHAAFMILERIRGAIKHGLEPGAASEAVAANTVFTTHTPVPAGHDHFTREMIERYFGAFCRSAGLPIGMLLAMGRTHGTDEFNMTALAVHGSRFHNGVSRIHGEVTSRMLAPFWPDIEPDENPITYITNGVHLPTVLAVDWHDLFDRHLGLGWMQRSNDPACWDGVSDIPDQLFWSVHQSLKMQMLTSVGARVTRQHARYQGSEAHLHRLLRYVDPNNPNILTIGFARRFAQYKRATLIFDDLDWLREILCHAERPAILIFAGKAHPADGPGQELIRRVAEVARMREFEGRILLIEGYDLHLARRLVAGCDVWLNNPLYPQEASGTSGMKAGVNGVLNLSVLDGWWDEGYDGTNGWAIKPAHHLHDEGRRNHEEARTLYELLQDEVVPAYYDRGPAGFSSKWIAMAKRSIASLSPSFSAARMVGDYVDKFYVPAARQGKEMAANDAATARALATWKSRVRETWGGVHARRIDTPARRIAFGSRIKIEVAVALNGLGADDVMVEMVVEQPDVPASTRRVYRLPHVSKLDNGTEDLYALELAPEDCGSLHYRLRVFPFHPKLAYRFEMGLLRWL